MRAEDLPSEREKRWRSYVAEIATGNAQSLASLYDETSKVLYALALRIVGNAADADEVLLEVFEQTWRSAHTFDPSRSGVWHWLTLMTRSRAVDRLRASATKRKREHPVPVEDWVVSSHDSSQDEKSVFRQQQLLIREALRSLPRHQREALELAYFSELTHVEIAATLKVPLGTIKTRIRSGMDKLRTALSQHFRMAVGSAR